MESTNQAQFPVNGVNTEEQKNVTSLTPKVLKNEYMAGGYLGNADVLLTLSHTYTPGILKDSVIDRMLKDPEIYKCISVIKNGVLGDGVSFTPAIPRPILIKKPEKGEAESAERKKERLTRENLLKKFDKAKSYSDFITRAFDNLEVPIRDVLEDMLDALAYGNKVAEKVFEPKFDYEFNTYKLYLKRIKVKPRKSTIFVTDKFKNLIGFKVYYVETDENGNSKVVSKVVPKDKFMVLTLGSKDGDPRGTSGLTSAYTAWQLKIQLWPEYLRWLIYSAVPPIVGYTSNEVDSKKIIRDANNEIVVDAAGNPVFESDVTAMLRALEKVRNASAIALPFGAKVETLNNGVSGDPFKGFRDVLNEEIEMGLIHQTLATSDSRHNTRAASQTHITILDELVWKVKGIIVDMLRDSAKHLLKINFEDYEESLTPIPSLGDTTRRDFASDIGGISQLAISNYIGESQKPGIDAILGLPQRDAYSDLEFERSKALDKLEMEAKVAKSNSTGVN